MSGDEPQSSGENGDTTGGGQPVKGNEESPVDVLKNNQEYVKETLVTYSAVAFGFGLSFFLLGAVGSLPVTVSVQGAEPTGYYGYAHAGILDTLSLLEIYLMPFLIMAIATFVGFDASGRFGEVRDGVISSGVASLAGAVLFTVIAGVFFSLELPSSASDIAGGAMSEVPSAGTTATDAFALGMDWIGLVTNGVIFGLGAGIATALIVYARLELGD